MNSKEEALMQSDTPVINPVPPKPAFSAPKPSAKEQEFQYLREDEKINRIMEVLKFISFGNVIIKKHKGKIAGYDFSGEIKFNLSEYNKPPKPELPADGNR